MALALLANTAPRIVAILGANPGTFSSTVSGDVGAFPSDAEILAATLEADEMVATEGYFQSPNGALATPFETVSSPLRGLGDHVPFHHGDIGKVEVTETVKSFLDANVTPGTDQIVIADHGYTAGDLVTLISSGTLPAGLALNTNYYVIVVNASTIKLASSYLNALAGTAVDITAAAGGGIHYVLQWINGVKADSKDDILNATAVGNAYVETGAFNYLYAIDDGEFYSAAAYGRVTYPEYTRTSVLQCNKNEESLIIATAVRLLTKNASPAPFVAWTNESIRGIQQLAQEGVYTEQMPA